MVRDNLSWLNILIYLCYNLCFIRVTEGVNARTHRAHLPPINCLHNRGSHHILGSRKLCQAWAFWCSFRGRLFFLSSAAASLVSFISLANTDNSSIPRSLTASPPIDLRNMETFPAATRYRTGLCYVGLDVSPNPYAPGAVTQQLQCSHQCNQSKIAGGAGRAALKFKLTCGAFMRAGDQKGSITSLIRRTHSCWRYRRATQGLEETQLSVRFKEDPTRVYQGMKERAVCACTSGSVRETSHLFLVFIFKINIAAFSFTVSNNRNCKSWIEKVALERGNMSMSVTWNQKTSSWTVISNFHHLSLRMRLGLCSCHMAELQHFLFPALRFIKHLFVCSAVSNYIVTSYRHSYLVQQKHKSRLRAEWDEDWISSPNAFTLSWFIFVSTDQDQIHLLLHHILVKWKAGCISLWLISREAREWPRQAIMLLEVGWLVMKGMMENKRAQVKRFLRKV